jgi:putative membrane protein
VIAFGDLPNLNAALNALSAVLLVSGWLAVKSGRKKLHRTLMLTALSTSAVFFVSYVTYHLSAGSTPFGRHDWTRPIYFTILISHTALAVTVPPLALTTAARALRGRFAAHRALARWALPIWLYVSVTGVVVWWMLYRI